MYDFSICKLCREQEGHPTYLLKEATVYVCGGCGFHYIDALDTVPDSRNYPSVLDQKGSDYIDRMLALSTPQQEANLAFVQRFCHVKGQRCLDVGAGAGLLCNLLIDAGAVVDGVEPQKPFRQYAAQRFGLELVAETVDHESWGAATGGYDAVTLFDVLEHVNFPRELLQCCHNLVKCGGWLFLDTPSRDSVYYRASEWIWRLSGGRSSLFMDSFYSSRPFRHKQIFARRELVQLLERTGFSIAYASSSYFGHNKLVLACRKNEEGTWQSL